MRPRFMEGVFYMQDNLEIANAAIGDSKKIQDFMLQNVILGSVKFLFSCKYTEPFREGK